MVTLASGLGRIHRNLKRIVQLNPTCQERMKSNTNEREVRYSLGPKLWSVAYLRCKTAHLKRAWQKVKVLSRPRALGFKLALIRPLK